MHFLVYCCCRKHHCAQLGSLSTTQLLNNYMEGITGAVRQIPRVRLTTNAELCMSQDMAQKTVRALFSEIECNGSAKTLSGKLFQCLVIDYECLQKIRRAECDTEANAVLVEHLYETSTEKTLQEFARILKGNDLPKQKVLGEQIEAVLTRTAAATANSTYENGGRNSGQVHDTMAFLETAISFAYFKYTDGAQ